MPGPNILLIVLDSVAANACPMDTLPNTAGLRARMPVWESLAREGAWFERALTTAPLCHPARSSLDTGLYSHLTGQFSNRGGRRIGNFDIWDDLPSYVQRLREAGYRTGYTGQQHLKRPVWDDFVPGAWLGLHAAGGNETPRDDRPQGKQWGTLGEGMRHRDSYSVDGAHQLLRQYAASESPWLIQCEFDGPHPPFVLPDEWARFYDPAQVPPPTSFSDNFEDKPPHHAICRERSNRNYRQSREWDDTWRQLRAHYLGYLSMLDAFTGEILDELERLELAEDTLVIVTSDHGELVGAHGVFSKYPMMWDEVIRVPLLVRWPGQVRSGTRVEGFVSHVDLWPTLVEIGGANPEDVPVPLHGRSWAAITRGEEFGGEASGFAQGHGSGVGFFSLRMTQTRDWKYVFQPYGPEELYDLRLDPAEMCNLANTRPDVLPAMRILMVEYMKRADDPLAGLVSQQV